MSKYKLPSIKDMIEAGMHFGHKTKRWHPDMEPYIYTVKKDIHIIDLEKTEELLKEAADFLYETTKNGGDVIFVGTKKQAADTIQVEAKNCGAMYVTERWIGGTLTNIRTIRKNVDKLLDLLSKRESGELEKYTKMERLLIDREIEKLQVSYGGITKLKRLPKAIFVIDPKREKTAVREARRCNVPVVALIDTNSDPNQVDYPIPGNDDAIKSILLVVRTLSSAIKEGYKDYDEKVKEEAAEEQADVPVVKRVKEEEVVKVEDEFVEINDEPDEKISDTLGEGVPDAEELQKQTKIDSLRDQIKILREKREEAILQRGKEASANKDLRENAQFDYWDQEERNLASQINMLMKEIKSLVGETDNKKSKNDDKKAVSKKPAKKAQKKKVIKKETKK